MGEVSRTTLEDNQSPPAHVMWNSIDLPFVADGRERAAAAIERSQASEIRTNVEAKYADELVAAGPLRRLWLRIWIRIEVRRCISAEIKRQAPWDALDFSLGGETTGRGHRSG